MIKIRRPWSDVNIGVVLSFLILLLLSGTAFVNITPNLEFLCIIPIIFSLTTLMKETKRTTIVFLLLLLMVLFSLLVNLGSGYKYYIMFGIKITSAYLIARQLSLRRLSEMFVDMMVVIAGAALIGYALVNLTDLEMSFPILGSGEAKYRTIGIFHVLMSHPERNCGFFWEPGIFASMLTLALCCLTLIQKTKEGNSKKVRIIWRYILLISALVTTLSSAGYVLLFLFFVFLVATKISKRNILSTIICWLVVVVLIVVAFSFESILTKYALQDDYYLSRMTVSGILSSKRMEYFSEGLELFFQNPLFGIGIIELNEVNATMGIDTSTSVSMLLTFGILGSIYTILIIRGVCRQRLPALAKVVLCIMMLAIVNKEPHTGILMTWLFIFASNLSVPQETKHSLNNATYLERLKI